MAAGDILMPRSVDVKLITYGAVKKQDNGSKIVWVNLRLPGGDKPLIVQTPEMSAPFGISVWRSDNGGPDKHSLDVSFAGRESRESVQEFYDLMSAFDKRLLQDAMDNSQAWFGKKFPSLDVVEALRTPMIKVGKGDYPPTFSMKLPFRDGKFQFPSFDTKRKEMDLFEVINSEGKGKGGRYRAILQCAGIWIVGTKFGCTWRVRQLMVSKPAQLTSFAFQRTEEDDLVKDEDEDPKNQDKNS